MILIVAFLGLIGEIAIIALATGSRISVGEAMSLGRNFTNVPPTVDLVLWIWTGRPPAEWSGT